MELSRGAALALAAPKCAICCGAGVYPGRRHSDPENRTVQALRPIASIGPGFRPRQASEVTCACVYRRVFRAVMERYQAALDHPGRLIALGFWQLAVSAGASGRKHFLWTGMIEQEFIADVELIARRHLSPAELRIWQKYLVEGLDWCEVGRPAGLDRGRFFHAVYRVQRKLGRAWSCTEPYAVFPVSSYFRVATRSWEDQWNGNTGPKFATSAVLTKHVSPAEDPRYDRLDRPPLYPLRRAAA